MALAGDLSQLIRGALRTHVSMAAEILFLRKQRAVLLERMPAERAQGTIRCNRVRIFPAIVPVPHRQHPTKAPGLLYRRGIIRGGGGVGECCVETPRRQSRNSFGGTTLVK